MMQSSGGSVGFQAGGQAVDYVILVLNDKGARKIMNGKAKLGADASIAAGPVGRNAEAATNAAMSAEMLSYSRTAGVFAGVSLSGTSRRALRRRCSRHWRPSPPRTCQPASRNNLYLGLCIAETSKRALRGNRSETSCGSLCRASPMKRHHRSCVSLLPRRPQLFKQSR